MSETADYEYEMFFEVMREDLYAFIMWAFTVLEPGAEFQDNWHIQAIVYELLRVINGENTRLLITMPPRSLKSLSVSVALVAWVLGRDPTAKFMCASYTEKPSSLLAQQTRTLMLHPDYRAAFPGTVIDSSAAEFLTTKEGGYRFSTSVSGAATGIGCDFVIADDLTKAAASTAERQKALEFFQNSLLSRFNNKATGAAIVVAQRTAIDDLPGYLIAQGGYMHLNLPAIAQADQEIQIGPNMTMLRRKGQPLHGARESLATLERVRRDMGAGNFAAQFLQSPNLALGAYLDPDWFPRYESPLPFHRYAYRVLSIDTAISTSTTADYSVISVFGVTDELQDLLEVRRHRLGYDGLSNAIDKAIADFDATHVVIEATGVGISQLQRLRQTYYSGVLDFHPIKSKDDRVTLQMEFFRRRSLRLPRKGGWLTAFETEVFSFPGSMYDDQVDTLTQFANYAAGGFDRHDPLDTYESENYRGMVWVPGERVRR